MDAIASTNFVYLVAASLGSGDSSITQPLAFSTILSTVIGFIGLHKFIRWTDTNRLVSKKNKSEQ